MDKRDIQPLDAGDAVHFSEIRLEVDFVEAERAFLHVAQLQLDHRGLVGAERPLSGKFKGLGGQPRDRGVGLGITELARQLAIELERLVVLTKFFLVDAGAFHQGAAGFRAFRIFANKLCPFLDRLTVSRVDRDQLALGLLQRTGLGLVNRSEQIEDARRTLIERMGPQKLVEVLQGKRFILVG